MNTCINCGKPCEKIGELNRMGIRKEYCCKCYQFLDKNFISKLWCKTCLSKEENQLSMTGE